MVTSLPPEEMKARTDEVGHVMIVADGMGGHAGGEQASRMAITGLIKLALARPDWIFRLDTAVAADVRQRSKKRVQDLHTLLLNQGEQDPGLHGMGTTLTIVRNMGRQLHIVHVGDSRAYLLRNGRLHHLTRDHTYVQLLIDSGQLSKEDAVDFRGRHILVNALGGFNEEVEVDLDQIALNSGDRILMCSDGLTDMVDDDTIRQVLVERHESQEACQRLIDLALERGGRQCDGRRGHLHVLASIPVELPSVAIRSVRRAGRCQHVRLREGPVRVRGMGRNPHAVIEVQPVERRDGRSHLAS